jgi:tRNA pseudouridine55 synthase
MKEDPTGILLVDKPSGMTSFGVVSRARRWFRTRRVGHTGSLDPFATGLLVLCVGRATRLAQYITDWDKHYEGVIRLGQETDTDDPTGEVLYEGDPTGLTLEQVEEAMETFRGEILQVPPRYSAKKKDGIPSYRRARSGQEVELPPVKVRISELELLGLELPNLRFRARCSKGTYMRALARDLGRALGCGAHLLELRRHAVGPLHVLEAVSPEALDRTPPEGRGRHLWSIDRALGHWGVIRLGSEDVRRVRHGQDVLLGSGTTQGEWQPKEGQCVRLTGEEGNFVAVGRITCRNGVLTVHPEMVWAPL